MGTLSHQHSLHGANSIDPERINRCVESLCGCGCSAVNAIIASLEQGYVPDSLRDLSESEQHAVLEELKAIMACYER